MFHFSSHQCDVHHAKRIHQRSKSFFHFKLKAHDVSGLEISYVSFSTMPRFLERSLKESKVQIDLTLETALEAEILSINRYSLFRNPTN